MKALKVLLVEDDENLSFALQERLKFEGCETRAAGDAVEAYLTFVRFRPDLVITDLQLPGESGVDLVRRVRHLDDPNVRTIYMSGNLHQFRSELEQEKNRPEVSLLAKPFSGDELMKLVSAV